MNKRQYLDLKSKYFTSPLYNNSIELRVIGFVAQSSSPISELDELELSDSSIRDLSVPDCSWFCYQVSAPYGVEE